MNKVGLLIIATNKYDRFIEPLLRSVEKYFFVNDKIDIYLFVDKEYSVSHPERLSIIQIPIKHYPFPYATLYRYKHFDDNRDKLTSEYLFYLDVDMLIASPVDKEILGEIVCVKHPGFYRGGWGSEGCDHKSLAYLPKEKRVDYKAGGFQGGIRNKYLLACQIMRQRIDTDEAKGVMAEWHDETHWNFYLKVFAENVKVLEPSYCYPESWKLPFPKKILALDKDHKAIRG